MKTILAIGLLLMSSVWAGITPTRVFLDSNISASQVRPSDQISLKAIAKDGEDIFYKFEANVDGVITTIQDFGENNLMVYTVPHLFKTVILSVSAQGNGDVTTISSSFKITYKGNFTFSKNKVYQLEEILVNHPQINSKKAQAVSIIASNGVTYQAIGYSVADGEMAVAIPRVVFSGKSLTSLFELKIEGVHTYKRQFIEIYNAPSLSGSNRVLKQGEVLSLILNEVVNLTDSTYSGIIDSTTPVSLFRGSDNTLAMMSLDLTIGLHKLEFTVNDLNFIYEFEVVEADVIQDSIQFLNLQFDEYSTFIEDPSNGLNEDDKNILRQQLSTFQNQVQQIDPMQALRITKLLSSNQVSKINKKKKELSLFDDCASQLKSKMIDSIKRIGGQVGIVGLALAEFGPYAGFVSFLNGKNAIAMWRGEIFELNELIACAGIKDQTPNELVVDGITKNNDRFNNGVSYFVHFEGSYTSFNKDSKISSSSIEKEIYYLWKAINIEQYLLNAAYPFESAFTPKFLSIDEVAPSSPKRGRASGNNIKIPPLINNKILMKFEAEKVQSTILFTSDLTAETLFDLNIIYNNRDIFRANFITETFVPISGCVGGFGKYYVNPDGSIGGFVEHTAKVSGNVTIQTDAQVCGNSIITGKGTIPFSSITVYSKSKIDNSVISGSNIRLEGDISNSTVRDEDILVAGIVSHSGFYGKHNFFNGDISNSNFGGNYILVDKRNNTSSSLNDAIVLAPKTKPTGYSHNIEILGSNVSSTISGSGPINVSLANINAPVTGSNIMVWESTINKPVSGNRFQIYRSTINADITRDCFIISGDVEAANPGCI